MTVEFGQVLRETRPSNQKVFAENVRRAFPDRSIDHGLVSRYESGDRNPSAEMAEALLSQLPQSGIDRPRFLLLAAGVSREEADAYLDVTSGGLSLMDKTFDAVREEWDSASHSDRDVMSQALSLASQAHYFWSKTGLTQVAAGRNSGYSDGTALCHIIAGNKKNPELPSIRGLLRGLEVPISARAAFVLTARGHSLETTLQELSHALPSSTGDLQAGIITQLPIPGK